MAELDQDTLTRIAVCLEKLCQRWCQPLPEMNFDDFLETLSVRSRRALDRMRIDSFEELEQTDYKDLLRTRNFAWSSLYEIGFKASRMGLKLWQDEDLR